MNMSPYIWRPYYRAAVLERDDHLLREKIARVEATMQARLAQLVTEKGEEYDELVAGLEEIRTLKERRLPSFSR